MKLYWDLQDKKILGGSRAPNSNCIPLPAQYTRADEDYLTVNKNIEEVNIGGEVREKVSYSFSVDQEARDQAIENRETEKAWQDLRSRRNALLKETDYLMTIDVYENLSEDQKNAIKNYRQTLRNLPENTEDPRVAVYPSKPQI